MSIFHKDTSKIYADLYPTAPQEQQLYRWKNIQ